MIQRIDAIFENGVFRPEEPVNISEGQRVSLNVESRSEALHDLSDVKDLLDAEYVASCCQGADGVPSLEEARRILSVFKGSLADRICEEREER